MSLSQLRVAVIGAGAISRLQHLVGWAQLPEARLVGLAEVSPDALHAAADEFAIPRRETDYRALLDDDGIDVIDVCVPSALHAEVSIAALQAGKHVLCEKPMATSRAGAAGMLAAQRAAGKKLMIAQHMRFDPSVLALRGFAPPESLGTVYYARAQWLRRRRLPGRPGFTQKRLSGGGALFDIGVHVLDLAWWLMGCPRPLTASGGAFDHLARRGDLGTEWGSWDPATIDVEDFAAGLLRFEGGGLLCLESSWLGLQAKVDVARLQVYGTRLGFVWPECRLFGETAGHPWDIQLSWPPGDRPHREAIRQFAHALLDDRPVPIPPEQSANGIAMLEALYRSAERHSEQPVEAFDAV